MCFQGVGDNQGVCYSTTPGWSVTPSTNAKDLNTCHDSYVGITNVDIYVA